MTRQGKDEKDTKDGKDGRDGKDQKAAFHLASFSPPPSEGDGPGVGGRALVIALLLTFLLGCHQDMRDQPRYDPLEASTFFADGQSSRPRVEGTIPRGQLQEDQIFHTGREGDHFIGEIPLKIDRAVILRGQERFNIFCAVCHAPTGNGDGMIVQRGFRQPPSLHIERLRNAPAGHLFDVMTNGFGAMPSYRVQVPPADRWAIVAYVRVLQMSQHATLDDVPSAERTKLMEPKP